MADMTEIPPARQLLLPCTLSTLALLFTFVAVGRVQAQAPEDVTLRYLKGLSIEELLQTEITSVSKKSEQLFNVAAAVTVITQKDIQRSGVQTIPEALRLVPGVQVAQIDGSRYAISARGFNENFATKLLVMIDGRSVYTPLFSGVFWNAQDTLIEDIDRIEVIRGPGATIWGANAVNGVINIITKNSTDTQGTYLSMTAGSHVRPEVSARYGGSLDDATTYRLFAKGFKRDSFETTDGDDAYDGWESLRAGFRLDRQHTPEDNIRLQGEIYDNEADGRLTLAGLATPDTPVVFDTERYHGGHLLATWNHRFSTTSDLDLQFYWDHSYRKQVVGVAEQDTLDLEFKHHWSPPGRHDLVWGGGFRWTRDDDINTYFISMNPDTRSYSLWSAFLQDDIALVDNSLWLTLGSKFEHNDYSHFEVQPSARIRYKPDDRQTIWGAISRAVRTPSRAEHDVRTFLQDGTIENPGIPLLPPVIPSVFFLNGTEDLDSEKLLAYELGYRWQASDSLGFDLALFYNVYDDLRTVGENTTVDLSPLSDSLPAIVDTYFGNGLKGNTYGFELQTTWQITEKWKISAAYSWIELDLQYKDPSRHGEIINEEKLTPQQQFQLRSYLDLSHNLTLDSELFFVDKLDDMGINEYCRVDLQLGWQPIEALTISAGVENLFDANHPEFPSLTNFLSSEIPRQFWVKTTFTF